MTNAVLSQVLPGFTQDKVCEFEPDGPGDEETARLESDAVNYVLMEQNRGYLVLYEAIKDALLLKNGILKAYLREDAGGRRIQVEAVDPLCFFVDDSQSCVLLDDYRSPFCAERKSYSRGDLIDMGFPRSKVELIPEGEDTGQSDTASQARKRTGNWQVEAEAGWANERVTVWECYSRLADTEEGGQTRLYRCLLGGQTLLEKEPVDYLPYATGSAFPEPHRFWGLSLFDRLKTVQDGKTAIKRQWLDNLANCNNSREAINDRVNRQTVTDGRPGNKVVVEGTGPVQEAIMPIPSIDVGPAAMSFLAYEDQVRADRGGAALQMASAEAQITSGQIGSMGVDRIFSVQEQLAQMIARTLAETLVRSVFLLVHRLLRLEYGEVMTLRLADQWVQADPSQWRPRARLNIRSGLSPGERSRKAAALTQVLTLQNTALQMGLDGVLVSLPNMYSAIRDWAAAQDLDAGEKYFSDPRSQQSQQMQQQKAQAGQQAQQMQMQMAEMAADLEKAKLLAEKYKTDLENQFNYWKERLHAEIEEAKLIGGATAELQRIELEGRFAAARGSSEGPGPGNAQ
jgi:hypothetical protein